MERNFVVIDNDTKEEISVPFSFTDAQNWASQMNKESRDSGGSSTQYGVAPVQS